MGAKAALNKTYKIINKTNLAKELRVSYQSIDSWRAKNKLPDTEYSGKTSYSKKIEEITHGEITVTDLLGWIPPHQA